LFQIAVIYVAESIDTELADTPAYCTYPSYKAVKKFNPVIVIVNLSPPMVAEETDGKVVEV